MSKKAKWVLPVNVHPETTTDWCIPVPDDPYYRAAFWGALQDLASWYKWAEDADHTAKDVARVWRDIIDKVKQCHEEPIAIVGEEWEDTLAICESLRWHNGVLQGYCCGAWVDIPTDGTAPIPGSGGQPGSGSRPGAGQSKCYTVTLHGSSQWLLPFAVQDGDIITISDANGAWTDGTVHWYCPDGTPFIFGQCVGAAGHDGADPDATDWHMQVIAVVGSEFYPASDGSFTLPGGTGSQQLILMANDGDRADNAGQITLKICVENGTTPPATEWCYAFNFILSDYDWEPSIEAGCTEAIYTPGEGFARGECREEYVSIKLPLFDVSHISTVTIEMDTPLTGSDKHIELITNLGESGQQVFDEYGVMTTSHTFEVDQDSVEKFYILLSTTDGNPADINDSKIVSVTVTGTGTNPFGSDNC